MANYEPAPEMIATNEEMDAARVPFAYRDYCAHHFMKFQDCLRQKFFHTKCHHEEIEWEKCCYNEHKRAERNRDLSIISAAEDEE